MTTKNSLSDYAGPLHSRVGGAFPGQRAIFRGHDLHRDLKDIRWLGLYLFGITGRQFSEPQLRVLDAIWTYTSYPDARLWNNRVAALAGSTRSSGILGISAALAVSEASIYGGQIIIAIAGFLEQAKQRNVSGETLETIVTQYLQEHRGIPGYGRPVRRMDIDERNGPILTLARQEGLADGPYVKLALQIEEILLSGRWRMRMNYAAMSAALSLDIGLAPQDHYLYMLPVFLAGMPPCYKDALNRPEGATFPLACAQIEYTGPRRRKWNNDEQSRDD